MKSVFRFKQFEVDQRDCAMKINTDGVLLAAIAEQNDAGRILDIGTGTGVIALMMAQRFSGAMVDAVEIDPLAAKAAGRNFKMSPFRDRMAIFDLAIEDFCSSEKYDLIVSNPPYFVNDLKNPDQRKGLARHASEDFFNMLLRKVASLINAKGSIWVILPVKQAEEMAQQAALYGLYPGRWLHIYSDRNKPEFRRILCLQHEPLAIAMHEDIFIYEAQGVYTTQYKTLLRDFLLAF